MIFVTVQMGTDNLLLFANYHWIPLNQSQSQSLWRQCSLIGLQASLCSCSDISALHPGWLGGSIIFKRQLSQGLIVINSVIKPTNNTKGLWTRTRPTYTSCKSFWLSISFNNTNIRRSRDFFLSRRIDQCDLVHSLFSFSSEFRRFYLAAFVFLSITN